MSVWKGILYELLGLLCLKTPEAELRSIEASKFAIGVRLKAISENDPIKVIDKMIKWYKKISVGEK